MLGGNEGVHAEEKIETDLKDAKEQEVTEAEKKPPDFKMQTPTTETRLERRLKRQTLKDQQREEESEKEALELSQWISPVAKDGQPGESNAISDANTATRTQLEEKDTNKETEAEKGLKEKESCENKETGMQESKVETSLTDGALPVVTVPTKGKENKETMEEAPVVGAGAASGEASVQTRSKSKTGKMSEREERKARREACKIEAEKALVETVEADRESAAKPVEEIEEGEGTPVKKRTRSKKIEEEDGEGEEKKRSRGKRIEED
eukprot:Platyproteum_vivax@DN7446_c0_g1_i4.p1